MKKFKLFTVAIIFASLLISSCTKELIHIEGAGNITTETLQIDEFTGINMEGVDDVIITYGTEQKVTVTGHPNIISRIKTNVSNKTWNIELEDGNYGNYELTYFITLPALNKVINTGTGNVVVNDFISQENFSVTLVGTGNFLGFPMTVKNCTVDISGTGDCEISVATSLDATIIGSGNIYYKGNPSIDMHISGSGSVIQMKD